MFVEKQIQSMGSSELKRNFVDEKLSSKVINVIRMNFTALDSDEHNRYDIEQNFFSRG